MTCLRKETVRKNDWRVHKPRRQRELSTQVEYVPDTTFPDVPREAVEGKQWKTAIRGRFQHIEHINRIEGRAVCLALRRAAKDPELYGKRLLHFSDSLSFTLGACKGRSSKYCLNKIYRRILALTLPTKILFRVCWIVGPRNPADEPSRPLGKKPAITNGESSPSRHSAARSVRRLVPVWAIKSGAHV